MNVNYYFKMTNSLNILINIFTNFTTLDLKIYFEPDEISIYENNDIFLLDLGVDKTGNYFYYYKDKEEEILVDNKDPNTFVTDKAFLKILQTGFKK